MNALGGAGPGQAAASGSTSDQQQQQSPQTPQMGLGASQQQLNLAMQNPVQMMQVSGLMKIEKRNSRESSILIFL